MGCLVLEWYIISEFRQYDDSMQDEQKEKIVQGPKLVYGEAKPGESPGSGISDIDGQAENPDISLNPEKRSANPRTRSEYQMICVLLLMIAIFCAPWINIGRAYALVASAKCLSGINSSWQIDAAEDLADAYGSAQQYSTSMTLRRNIVAACRAQFGDNDQRTGYARLCLALHLNSSAKRDTAREEIAKALPAFAHPTAQLPQNTTIHLLRLARKYSYDDYFIGGLFATSNEVNIVDRAKIAKGLYEAAIKCSPYAYGNYSVSNMQADLAGCDEYLGQYEQAILNMKAAQEATECWGSVEVNVFRLGCLCRYYNELHQYKEAAKFGEQSVAMAGRCMDSDHLIALNVIYELARTKYYLGEFMESKSLLLPVLKHPYSFSAHGFSNAGKFAFDLADNLQKRGHLAAAKDLYKALLDAPDLCHGAMREKVSAKYAGITQSTDKQR